MSGRGLVAAVLAPGAALALWVVLGAALFLGALGPQGAALRAAGAAALETHGMVLVLWWLGAALLAGWLARRLYRAWVLAPSRLLAATRILAAQENAAGLPELAPATPATRALAAEIESLARDRQELRAEMARLEGQGRGVLGQLYGNVDALTGRLGTALGGSGANAGRLLSLLTPLVLGLLGRTARTSRMSPVVLSGLLGAMQDKLPGLIPAGMGGLAALLGTGTAQAQNAQAQTSETVVASTTPRVVENVAAAKPVTPAAPVVTPPVTTATTTSAPVPERRGGIPWWVWLLPLLLLGGCWFVNNQNKTDTTTSTTSTTTTQQDGGIIVSNPQSDSNLPAQPFTMSGTAAPNMQLKIEDEGQTVAEATADADGNWTAEIPAPTVGEHTYSIIGGEGAKSEFKVNVTDENAQGGTDATGTDTSDTDSTGTDGAAAGDFTVTEPAQNADVAATGFNLTGTGTPGETYELLEDGVSVGTFTVGDDGNWTADVAAPSEGDKTYTIQDGSGNEVATLPVKVGAGTADAGQCSQDLSVSLEDGETVSAPFRFGGVGSSDSYTVTIRRADRVIGTKKIPLGAGCTWSYSSNPGGRSGTVNDVTYEVRASGTAASAPADATLNLKVRAR